MHRDKRRREIRQAGLAHPVAQIQRVAAIHRQLVRVPDHGTQCAASMLGSAAGSSTPRDLQLRSHMGVFGFMDADEPPSRAGTGHRVTARRGWNAEGAGLGDRLVKEVDQPPSLRPEIRRGVVLVSDREVVARCVGWVRRFRRLAQDKGHQAETHMAFTWCPHHGHCSMALCMHGVQ